MKTCPECKTQCLDDASKCFCGHDFSIPYAPPVLSKARPKPAKLKIYGVILTLIGIISPIFLLVYLSRQAEQRLDIFNAGHPDFLTDHTYQLFGTWDSGTPHDNFHYEIITMGSNGYTYVSNAVIRFPNGEIWGAGGGQAIMLWGSPFSVIKAHILLFLPSVFCLAGGLFIWKLCKRVV